MTHGSLGRHSSTCRTARVVHLAREAPPSLAFEAQVCVRGVMLSCSTVSAQFLVARPLKLHMAQPTRACPNRGQVIPTACLVHSQQIRTVPYSNYPYAMQQYMDRRQLHVMYNK